jgi:hypothetical protein
MHAVVERVVVMQIVMRQAVVLLVVMLHAVVKRSVVIQIVVRQAVMRQSRFPCDYRLVLSLAGTDHFYS